MYSSVRIQRQESAGAFRLCLAFCAALVAFVSTTSHAGLVGGRGAVGASTIVGASNIVGASTIVAYSAPRGEVALDGIGASRNSPYTGALLRFLEVPIDVGLMLRLIRDVVLESTSGNQEPTIVHSSNVGPRRLSCGGFGVSVVRRPTERAERSGPRFRTIDGGTALTIGNGDYASSPLRNPLHDAPDTADALERLGFAVIRIENVGRDALERSLAEFGELASVAEIAVVYYAGHMLSTQDQDYLVPVDANLGSGDDPDAEFIPMSRVMSAVERASVLRLVIIDGPSGRWPPRWSPSSSR